MLKSLQIFILNFFLIMPNQVWANDLPTAANGDITHQSCAPNLVIFEGGDLVQVTSECPKSTNFKSLEDQQKGCDCVSARKNPISCEDFNHFENIVFQNRFDIGKLKFLNDTKKTLSALSDIGIPGSDCQIQEEINQCTFPNGKSLNEILNEYRAHQLGEEITSTSDLKFNNDENELSDNLEKINITYYGNLQRKTRDLDIDESITDYINERMIPPFPSSKTTSEERGEKEKSSIAHTAYNVRNFSEYSVKRIQISTQELTNQLQYAKTLKHKDLPKGFEELSEKVKQKDPWYQIGNSNEKDKLVQQYFENIDIENKQRISETFKNKCINLKRNIKDKCQYLQGMEADNKPMPTKLDSPEIINLVRQQTMDAQAKSIPKSQADERSPMINYLVEWFSCGTLYYDNPEKFALFSSDREKCNKTMISSMSSEELKESLEHQKGSYKELFNFDDLSEDELEELKEEYNYIADYLQEAGILMDSDDSIQSNQPLSNNNITQNPSVSPNGNSTNATQTTNTSSGKTFNSFNQTSFGPSAVTPTGNTSSNKSEAISGKKFDSSNSNFDPNTKRIEELLKELDEKRKQLEDLESKLAEQEKSSDKKSQSRFEEEQRKKIRRAKEDISNLESRVNDIAKSKATSQDQKPSQASSTNQPRRSLASNSQANTESPRTTASTRSKSFSSNTAPDFSAPYNSGGSSYETVNKQTLLSNALNSTNEFSYENNPINILGTNLASGIINIASNTEGDLLQIYEENRSDSKKVDILFQFQLSTGQGIESVISSLRPVASNFDSEEEFADAKSNFQDFENRVILAYQKHKGIKLERRNNEQRKPASTPSQTPKRRKAEYDKLEEILDSEVK